MRLGFGGLLPLAIGLGSLLLGAAYGQARAATKQVVTAPYVKQAPTGLDDPVWREAPGVEIPMEGKERFAGKKTKVTMKAVHTDETVHLWFTWPDATHSVTKGAWQFDGKAWSHLKGDEDRLALLFEVTRIDQFATKGCTVVCHVPTGQPTKYGLVGTKTEAEKGDLWHWKAARSAPYGHADDGWVTVPTDKTGRKNDTGKGGDFPNQTEDKTRPLFRQDPAKPASVPGVLLKEEAVEIKDYSSFKAGDIVPYRLPQRPEGSRFDIKAVSRYAAGGWTLLLSRKLDTGHEDDVVFNPRREYNFALALFDDSGDEHSYDSEVLALRFRR
jgi:hypothetical protein